MSAATVLHRCLRVLRAPSLLLLLLPCASHAAETPPAKPCLAVMSFETKNVEEATTQTVTELVQSLLENSGQYTMVERHRIETILKEQVFQYSGEVDESTAIQVGRMLGARKLVLGSVNRLGEGYIVSGRIVDVETGTIDIAVTRASRSLYALNDAVVSLVKALSEKDRRDARRAQKLSLERPHGDTFALYATVLSPVGVAPSYSNRVQNRAGTESFAFAVRDDSSSSFSPGVGAQYFLKRWLYLDLGVAPPDSSRKMIFTADYTNTSGTRRVTTQRGVSPQSPLLFGSLNTRLPLTSTTHLLLGAGAFSQTYKTSLKTPVFDYEDIRDRPGNAGFYSRVTESELLLYFLTAGAEWKLGKRGSIAVTGNYIFSGTYPQPRWTSFAGTYETYDYWYPNYHVHERSVRDISYNAEPIRFNLRLTGTLYL